MSDQLKDLLEAAKTDIALQVKLKAAANLEAAVEIAHEAGFTISSENLLRATEEDDLELEVWQLEAMSGGKGRSTQYTQIKGVYQGCR